VFASSLEYVRASPTGLSNEWSGRQDEVCHSIQVGSNAGFLGRSLTRSRTTKFRC
jgi:hypothetical protein